MRVDLRVYALTVDVPELGRDHADVAHAALMGGATCVQFRDKGRAGDPLVAEATRVQDECRAAGVPFVVNDHVALATALEADGLHVGQSDLGGLDGWAPSWDAALGVSITDPVQVDAALRLDPDYLGVGPVFPTPSKDDAADPMGLDGLAAVRQATDLPLVAIGGITLENASEVIAAGADGVAVISAIASAPDPTEAARGLRAAVDEALARRRSVS